MENQHNTSPWWQIFGSNFPYRQLIFGALVPISIFYSLHRFSRPLTGALLAISWGICLIIVTYWRTRRIELFAGLAIPIILIELIGTLITRNPDFYLASAAIGSVLWGIVFLGSMILPKPLIQIFAELLNPGLGSQEFLSQNSIPKKLYRSAWQILTAIWGVVNLLTAIILIFSQLKLPLETFLLIKTATGLPIMVALLFLSYRFPGWYWERARDKTLS
jgi:intracellular septation protein A